MTEARASAMAHALDQSVLPTFLHWNGHRAGTLRIGAFAPQYDRAFNAAADRASRTPGTSDDQAMLAGFCAVTRAFIKRYESVAQNSDAVVGSSRRRYLAGALRTRV